MPVGVVGRRQQASAAHRVSSCSGAQWFSPINAACQLIEIVVFVWLIVCMLSVTASFFHQMLFQITSLSPGISGSLLVCWCVWFLFTLPTKPACIKKHLPGCLCHNCISLRVPAVVWFIVLTLCLHE